MLKVGITGGIGSGKSMVCRILESMGYPVFYSDDAARELSDSDPVIRKQLTKIFGKEVYTDSGLNRPFLAAQIFADETLRQQVNNIIHPRVREAYTEFVQNQDSALVFNEAAILIETGAYKNFDAIVLVTAPTEVRIERVRNRDKASREAVKQRIEKQWSDDQKVPYASHVIVNDGEQPLLSQIEKMIDHLTSSQGS